MAAGVLFPEREVIHISFLIAAEGGRLDAVRVVGVSLGIDEFIVPGPAGAGFAFKIWREDDDTAVALAEMAEDRLGIGGKQQVGYKNADRIRTQRQAGEIGGFCGIRGGQRAGGRQPLVGAQGGRIERE